MNNDKLEREALFSKMRKWFSDEFKLPEGVEHRITGTRLVNAGDGIFVPVAKWGWSALIEDNYDDKVVHRTTINLAQALKYTMELLIEEIHDAREDLRGEETRVGDALRDWEADLQVRQDFIEGIRLQRQAEADLQRDLDRERAKLDKNNQLTRRLLQQQSDQFPGEKDDFE